MDTLTTYRPRKPKNRLFKKPKLISSWMLWILRPSVLANCEYGILVLSPKKGISQIIIYQVARSSAAETALLAQFELAHFWSYNKATAFYYSKIMLLLSFFARQDWDSSRRSLLWKEGIWGIIQKNWKRGYLKWTQRTKNKMNKIGDIFKQKQTSEAKENKRKQTWFV